MASVNIRSHLDSEPFGFLKFVPSPRVRRPPVIEARAYACYSLDLEHITLTNLSSFAPSYVPLLKMEEPDERMETKTLGRPDHPYDRSAA